MSSVDRQPEAEAKGSANGREKSHWRSPAELDNAPQFRAFMEAEFPAGTDPKGINRRRWLQLMGASMALAGMAGCRWRKEEVLPFVERPDGRVPGEPKLYNTAMDLAGNAAGLTVTSMDGRPIKIEGNSAHPISRGATSAFAQAAILELYDPDRSQFIIKRGASELKQTWEQFGEFLQSHLAEVSAAQGKGLCVLSEASSSPTLAVLRERLLKTYPQAQWFEYEPISRDNERAGTQAAFDRPLRMHLALDQAKTIVCLDADILGDHPAALKYARQFADGRDPDHGPMNRLYVIESGVSITGAMADHRLPLRSGQIAQFVAALRDEIQHASADGGGEDEHHSHDDDKVGQFVHALAADLNDDRGKCVIVAGPGQPAEVHAEVHRLNDELDKFGMTVAFTEAPDPDRPSHVEAIKALTKTMKAGEVNTLLILGGNPVYDAPADLEFSESLNNVDTTIHLGPYRNETALECLWHLPQAHFLESWGDARAYDGTYSVVQPMIEPLYGGKTAIELLAMLLNDESPAAEKAVRSTHDSLVGGDPTERRWRQTLHDGKLAESEWPPQNVSLDGDHLPAKLAGESKASGLEIVFCADASVFDGRFANSGWLQECPRPLSNLTWDNAAIMAPATAEKLGVEFESRVKLKYGGSELELPVFVLPGQAPGSIAVALGYGRTAAGRVGGQLPAIPTVGVDAYQLRTSAAMYFDSGVSVERVSGRYRLATTQDHHAIDEVGLKERAKRLGKLVRSASVEHYREHPDFAKHVVHHPELESMWDEHKYKGHRWGMSIDLSKCIGCNACVVACQAENNIPVVGKEQVLVGREMHWIRVDRYFEGDANDPGFAHQPVACHHCELAPCEQVCPVNATVHSSEGLNDMVYNRCVGTRYCGNNCPYKVRRFNYFNFHKDLKDANNEISKLMYNPEVTVRARGVMEKCTYCVQRIQDGKILAKNERREIGHDDIKTACQQVCPTQAINFGDLANTTERDDPQRQLTVARQRQLGRSYALLAELNVKPRTTYLAKITNPNPEFGGSHEEHVGSNH